jgi:SAM-dependent methyltransferase
MTANPNRIATEDVVCDYCGEHVPSTIVSRGRDFEYDTCANDFTFVRCDRCDLVFLNPRPTVDTLGTIYPPSYEPFHFDEMSSSLIGRARNLMQKRSVGVIAGLLPQDAVIIDAGCGSGQLLALLQRYGSKSWTLYGNDISTESLARIEQRLGIGTIPGRFEAITTDVRFDMIILNQTIEHLDRPSHVVAKAAELLRPGGVLFIETPSLDGVDHAIYRRRYWGGYHFPRHWVLFTERTLRRVMTRFGLETVRVDYLPSPAFWIQSVHHLLADKGFPRLARFWTIRNPLPLAMATAFDVIAGKLYRTSNMRLVARKPIAERQKS